MCPYDRHAPVFTSTIASSHDFLLRLLIAIALVGISLFVQACKEHVTAPTHEVEPPPIIATALDSLTLTIVNQASSDTLLNTVRVLTGEQPFMMGDTTVTIVSRFPKDSTHAYAVDYIKSRFESYHLPVTTQPFTWASHPEYHGVNLVATQLGTTEPDSVVIICAHYDAAYGGGNAPGADDNASGVAATIEAARILSGLQTRRTIVYACWDMEEEGLIGSEYFVADAKARGMGIVSVLNLDQIGVGGPNYDALFSASNSPFGMALMDTMARLNQVFKFPIKLITSALALDASDHASFWAVGYEAAVLIEWPPSEIRHTPNDLSTQLKPYFFRPSTQLAIALVYRLSIL
jgi:hypothetical protein